MKVRRVLRDSSSLYVHHCWRLVPPAILLAVVPASPILLLPPAYGEGVAAVLALPVMFALQALHVVASAEVREGRPRPIWRSAAELRPALKRLLVVTLLACVKLVVYLAAFALIAYAAVARQSLGLLVAVALGGLAGLVYLVARWSLLVPVVVLEDLGGRKAFKRCGRLVGRHVFGVLGVLFVGAIVYAVGDVVALLVIHASVMDESGRAFGEKIVSEPLIAPFLALLGTTVYFALRDERDGRFGRVEPALA